MRKTLIAVITFIAGLYYILTFVIPPYMGGDFDNLRAYDPFVLKSDSKYLMWYGGYYNETTTAIGYAKSDDGYNWKKSEENPVIGASRFSSFDAKGIYSPRIVEDGEDGYVMYYVGRGADEISRIMKASSRDGIKWTGREKVLDLADPAIKWSKPRFKSLEVLKSDSLYEMWFTGTYVWKGKAVRGLSYATSNDGTNWELYEGNPVLQPESESWDSSNLLTLTVIKEGDTYKMWYVGTNQRLLGKNNFIEFGNVGYATSNDGINWEKHTGNPVFTPVYHFPKLSEVRELDEEGLNEALDRIGYDLDLNIDEKKEVLAGVINLLSNVMEPFSDWPDERVSDLLASLVKDNIEEWEKSAGGIMPDRKGEAAEIVLELAKFSPEKPVEPTEKEKKDAEYLRKWHEETTKYEQLKNLREQIFNSLQSYFTGKLGEKRDVDIKYFDSWNIGSMCVVKENSKYRMYYTGVNGFNSRDFIIGIAESEDGITWNRIEEDDKGKVVISTGEKGTSTRLWQVESTVTNLIVIIASFAIGLGVINLGRVNIDLLAKRKKGWPNAVAFFIGLISMFFIALFFRKSPHYSAQYKLYDIYYGGILYSFGAMSMGILAFYLASASYRTFKLKGTEAGVMMITAMLIMLGQVPIGQWMTRSLPSFMQIQKVSGWILLTVNGAAMRAITIGTAAGAMVMAYRLWLSKERRD